MTTDRVLGERVSATGVVHLGAGSFARAHPWLCTAAAVDAEGGGPWGVCAVGQRSTTVVESLRSAGWRYTVTERDGDERRVRPVGVVRDGLVAASEPDRLVATLADPAVRVVTVTVTEAGYPSEPASPRLRTADPAVVADIEGPPGRTVVGQVLAAASARSRGGSGPFSVVVCDNVTTGGALLRGLVLELAALRGDDDVATWVDEHVSFPESVVDRVVPAVADEDQPDVTSEAFLRWVLQDDFAGGRPAWERGGARLVDDVAPWQAAKLGLVNAPHSLLAYAGLACGHETTAQACTDPVQRAVLERALADDLVPSLLPAPGLDPVAEAASSVRRFANTGIVHRLQQIAADGSHKLPQRLTGPFRARLAAGTVPSWLTLTLACWAHAVHCGTAGDGRAGEVCAAWTAPGSARVRAQRLLDLPGLLPEKVGTHPDVVASLADWCERMERHGVRRTLAEASRVDGKVPGWT